MRPPNFGGARLGGRGLTVKCYATDCQNKLATKLAKVFCDRLILAHSANFIILIFVVVSHIIFWRGCFAHSSNRYATAEEEAITVCQVWTGIAFYTVLLIKQVTTVDW